MELLKTYLQDTVIQGLIGLGSVLLLIVWALLKTGFKKMFEKVEKVYRDITPDKYEPQLDKLFADFYIEILKELNGQESKLSVNTRNGIKDIMLSMEDKAKETVMQNTESILKDKVIELTQKVSENLLDKAENKIINSYAFNDPKMTSITENKQVSSIIKETKEFLGDKDHMYNLYAELEKKKDEELEGKVGANFIGRL